MRRWSVLVLIPAVSLGIYAALRRPLVAGMYDGTIPVLEALIRDRNLPLAYWQERVDYGAIQLVGIAWTMLAAFGLRSHPSRACAWLAGMGLVCVAMAGVHPFATRLIVTEGGSVFDLCTGPIFILGSVAMAVAALRSRGARRRWGLLLAVFLFICGGEEMSYLQHLLGYETSEIVARHNLQGEFNIHNQFEPKAFDTVFLVSVLFFFLVLPSFAGSDGPTSRLVRTFFLLVSVYFAVRVFLTDDRGRLIQTWFYRVMLGVTLALAVWGPSLCARGPVRRVFRSFTAGIDMGRGLRTHALVLLLVWVIAGLRFGSLGDLRFLVTGLGYNNDNEIFELYASTLFMRLAWVQLDVAPDADAAPTRV